MSKPIDQEREAFEEKLASIAITIQGVQRMLQDLSLKRWPDNNHDLTGDYVNANINHAAQGAKTHLPALNDALILIGDLFADDAKPAGVAVPENWEDRIYSAMTKAFEVGRLREGGMCIDDTQVGVEFACEHIRTMLANPTPPASEQQQAVQFYVHERVAVGEHALRQVVMPDPKRILAPDEFLAELLRLNPHLAKGEGV